jgi:hypothetical protein
MEKLNQIKPINIKNFIFKSLSKKIKGVNTIIFLYNATSKLIENGINHISDANAMKKKVIGLSNFDLKSK